MMPSFTIRLSRLSWIPLLPLLLPNHAFAQTPPAAPAAAGDVTKDGSLQGVKDGASEAAKAAIPSAPAETGVQKVQIKGGYNERRQDTASKTVITHEEIVRYGDTSLSDVLKRLPGVTTGNGIRLRGLGNGYTQILLNGEPAPPGFAVDSLTPDSIEKIEIVRAASAEFSTQAIAGTINIVTKKTVQNAQRELKTGFSRQAGEYSEFANLQRSDKLGRFSYTLAGNLFHARSQNDGENRMLGTAANGAPNLVSFSPQHYINRFDGIFFNPRLNWKLENGDTLISQTFIRHFDSYNQSREQTQTLLGNAPPYPQNQSNSRNITGNLNTSLNWLHSFANGGKLDFKLGLNYGHRDGDQVYLGSSASLDPLLLRNSNASSVDSGTTLSGKYAITTGKEHNWVLGWDGGVSQRRDRLLQLDKLFTGADPAHYAPINLDEHFNVSVKRLALFGQDEWSVTPRWSVYLGMRWEGVQTASEGDSVQTSRNRSSVLSPILQTLWKLPDAKDTQLRLALARTYKAPSLTALNARRSFSLDNSSARPDTQGNPDLRPELAWGLDLALEHFLPDGGILSASTYVRRIDDVTANALVQQQDGRWVSMPVNSGQALSHGIELEAKMPLRVLITDAPAIDFRFNLTRNWSHVSTIPGPDNRLDQQTPLSANLGIDYKAQALPLTLGGNFSFQSNGTVRTSAHETATTSPGRALDMYALWKFSKADQLRLSFSDMLHTDYRYASSFVDTNGSLSQSSVSEHAVTLRLGLEHKF